MSTFMLNSDKTKKKIKAVSLTKYKENQKLVEIFSSNQKRSVFHYINYNFYCLFIPKFFFVSLCLFLIFSFRILLQIIKRTAPVSISNSAILTEMKFHRVNMLKKLN